MIIPQKWGVWKIFIMHSKTFTMSDFLDAEGDEMLLLRLEALCEDKCDDLALKLAAAYVKHMNVSNVFNKFDINQINDIVLVLLYKYDKTQEIIEKVKMMKLDDGLQLLQRFGDHCKSVKRIWKYSDKVIEIASHTILASAMVKVMTSEEDHKLLFDLISQWALIHIPKFININSMAPIENMVRKIIKTAESSLHVYIFTQVLRKQFGEKVKNLCVELYIRALTANMNEIEQQKITNDIAKINEAESILADGFLQLGELLSCNKYVCRECLLTAFSLKPTNEVLEKIKVHAAEYNNNNSTEAKQSFTSSEQSNSSWPRDSNRTPSSQENTNIDIGLNLLDSELSGLAPHLADDLSTVISGPRCQLLSWSMGWEHLLKECEKYMADYNSSRHKNKELKFLNLDYSLFKDWPSQTMVSTGIEKGYEHLVDVPKVKQKRKKSVNSNSKNINNKKGNVFNVCGEVITDSSFTSSDSESSQFSYSAISSSYKPNRPFVDQSLNDSNSSVMETANYSNNPISNTGTGPEFNCTTPVSKMEDQEKWNLQQPCSIYKSSSPLPAEVPPAALNNSIIKGKFIPILQSLNLNPKVLLTDILNLKKQPVKETVVKGGMPDRENLDILAQAVMRSDILLAKSVPGMNSLDMIIPQPQETTVQVVQISSSTNSLLTQSVSNSGVSQNIQQNSLHSRAKPPNDNVSESSHSQNSFNQGVESNSSDNRSVVYSIQSGQSVPTSHTSVATTTTSNLTISGSQILLNNTNPTLVANRVQGLKPSLSTQTTDQLAEDHRGDSTVELSSLSSQDSGTQVTSHIQSIGQPHKLKLQSEPNCTNKNSTTNSSSSQTSAMEEAHKSQSQGNPVYRLVVKDGRVIEQYFQTNQTLDPVLSIPDSSGPENASTTAQTYNQNQFIKLLNRKKEFKTKEELLAHKVLENELLPPSLPKFHQVFRRQKYQSGPALPVENNSVMSSPTHFESNSPNNDKLEVRSTTPISKGVQTVSKEAENTSKNLTEKLRSDATAQVAVPSTSVQSDSVASSATSEIKENRASSDCQPSSGVIFTCKVPISISNTGLLQGKPVTILKATSTADVIIPNPKIETEIRNKDSVIRSNMNALLAAALQSNPPIKHTVINNNANSGQSPSNVKNIKIETPKNPDVLGGMSKIRMPTPAPKTFRRHSVVPQGPSRFVRPLLQVSTGNSMTQTGPPVVTIPLPARTVVLATNLNQNSLNNLSKIETRREQINPDQSVSSTTLEQLREFESVLEQVTNTSQMKERGNVNKKNDQNLPHSSENSDFSQNSSKVNSMFQPSIVNTISDMNSDRVSLTFISKASPANTSNSTVTLATSNAPKITTNTPVVVVQSCSRPLASPALSIASQTSSPAPQTPPANAQSKLNAKINKPKTKSSVGKTAPTTTLKVSTLPKPQQKPQEDEQTTQRIYAILDKYAEQLRNSPELKNKPAPRRRSNPPTNPTQSSKRKKSQNKSKSISNLPSCSGLEMSPGSEDLRTLGSEDSSNGVSQISQLPNSPQSKNDEHSNPPGGDVSSEASESLDAKDQRSQHRILLTEPSPNTSRTVLVQENIQPMINVEGTKVLAGKQLVVGSGATVPLTLSLPVAGNVKQVIFPVPADGRFVVAKGPKMYRVHQVTMPTGSPLLTTAGSGAVVLRQMCLNKSNSTVKQVKLPVVSQIQSQNLTNISAQPTVVLPSGSQSFTLSTGSGIETESLGIALDNTILLNTSTASSLGFFQRNISKSGQVTSPNVFTNTKPSCSLDQNNSTFPTNSDHAGNSLKSEPIVSGHGNLDASKKRVNNSSQCDDFKPKTEEIQFSISGEAEKLVTNANFIGAGAKNWSHVLKDMKNDMIIDNQGNKKLSESQTKKEFSDDKDWDIKESQTIKEGKQHLKSLTHTESINKKKNDDGTSFREEHGTSHESQCTKVQGLPNHSSTGHQWQFNVGKLEKGVKEVKTNPLSPSVQDGKTQTIMQNSGLGLKRKLNVENTIFQVAFKRSDRLKVSKDEFMQQRNSALSLERELRLQKSLSEECEDLGVDKPSTSDLFPEAELLLDSDPLSRDSLQELYSRGMESSSSSHDSPNRCSPPVLSDMVTNRYSGSWRKKKEIGKRAGYDNSPRDNNTLNKESAFEQKSNSSCEEGPINGSSLITPNNETKTINSTTLVFKTSSQNSKDHGNIGCEQHPAINTLNLIAHDSDNFSDGEPQCNDILDAEGDSDSELQNSCKHGSSGKMADMRENDVSDKNPHDPNQSPNILSRGNCTYTYQNYLQKGKSHEESNIPWFHMVKSQHHNDLDDEELRKGNLSRSSIVWRTTESIVEDIRRNDSPKDDSQDISLICEQSVLRNNKNTGVYKEAELASRGKKRKKVGMYLSSGGEDSGSSLDTLLEEADDCLEIEHSRRNQPRKTKKGCSCFNGNQELAKKKKEMGSSDKTEKPCSAPKSASYHSITNKKPGKPVAKGVNKKR